VANVVAGHRDLIVELGPWEAAVCWRRSLRRPLAEAQLVRVDEDPFAAGCPLVLAPGLVLPRKLALGVARGGQGKEFLALHTGCPALVIDLDGPWRRIRVSHPDAPELARELAELLLSRRSASRPPGPGLTF
jgi:hypothetical protein